MQGGWSRGDLLSMSFHGTLAIIKSSVNFLFVCLMNMEILGNIYAAVFSFTFEKKKTDS